VAKKAASINQAFSAKLKLAGLTENEFIPRFFKRKSKHTKPTPAK